MELCVSFVKFCCQWHWSDGPATNQIYYNAYAVRRIPKYIIRWIGLNGGEKKEHKIKSNKISYGTDEKQHQPTALFVGRHFQCYKF